MRTIFVIITNDEIKGNVLTEIIYYIQKKYFI